MDWKDVGDWLKGNAGTGAALVGSLLTGNIPGAIAAGVSMVSSATGTADPSQALAQLQGDPQTIVKLKELANQNEQNIREHIRLMAEADLKDKQQEQEQTQLTIRNGDTSQDEYVRHTRPMMARQSWYVGSAYVLGAAAAQVASYGSGPAIEVAMLLFSPAFAYLGLRTFDKYRSSILGQSGAK